MSQLRNHIYLIVLMPGGSEDRTLSEARSAYAGPGVQDCRGCLVV